MRRYHRAAALGLAAALCIGGAGQAMAASSSGGPGVAGTAKERAALEDNVLEYGEIADLVHEYNTTVINNRRAYEKAKDGNHSRSDGDIAASYWQAAENLYDQIANMDPDLPGYDATVLSLETQAKSLENSAVQAEIGVVGTGIQNEQAEAAIVASTKTLMIQYYQNLVNLDLYQKNLELLREQYNAVLRKADPAVGMATQTEVLTAKSAVENMETTILSTEKTIANTKQQLCLNTGWAYNAEPELGPLPTVDLEEIAAIDFEADKERAVENNYTLAVNRAQYHSTRLEETRETLEDTMKDNESNIRSSVTTNYQSLLQAQASYEQAQAELALTSQQTETAALNYSIGMISSLEYKQAEYAKAAAEAAVTLQEMALLQALETYRDSVNGLASAGAA